MYELPWDRVGMTPISSYPELHAICFYESDIITLSLTHTHTTHTPHAQTALSLSCIDFKIIFSFTTYSRQNIMTIGFEAFVFSQSRRASQCLACHSHEEGTTKDESYNEDFTYFILDLFKIYWKRKTSLNKLKTLQQLKWSNLLISRTQLKLM